VRQFLAKSYNFGEFAEAALSEGCDGVRWILLIIFSSEFDLKGKVSAQTQRSPVAMWITKLSLAWLRANMQPHPQAKLMRGQENVSQSMFFTSRSLYSGRNWLTAPMS
jgi:hypothetical protein